MVFFYTIIVVAFFAFFLNLSAYKEDNPKEKNIFKAIKNAFYDTRFFFFHPSEFFTYMLLFSIPAFCLVCIVIIICKIFMAN